MAEQVQTGGVMQFDYSRQKKNEIELEPERKDAIEVGYAEADARKKKERRNNMTFWVIAALIILLIIGYFILKR